MYIRITNNIKGATWKVLILNVFIIIIIVNRREYRWFISDTFMRK